MPDLIFIIVVRLHSFVKSVKSTSFHIKPQRKLCQGLFTRQLGGFDIQVMSRGNRADDGSKWG